MAQIEDAGKTKLRRTRIQDVVLMSLYGAGVIALAVAAPNALRILTLLDPYIDTKTDPSRRMQQAARRLIHKGLVQRISEDGKTKLVLTKKGETLARKLEIFDAIAPRKKKWDGRWRIVMFDVWERRKYVRERLRHMLIRVGFEKVQDSVWAYPYDCEELIAFIRTDLRLGRGVLYLIADAIEGDKDLRMRFGLPPQ
jgi:hypothetical protein